MIKARVNKDKFATCENCGAKQDNTLNLFDFRIGQRVITLCDVCNEALLSKTLKCECFKNARIKSGQDRKILRDRKINL